MLIARIFCWLRRLRAEGNLVINSAFLLLLVSTALCAGDIRARSQGPSALLLGRSFQECKQCPEMVWLPSGQFLMGTEPAETKREGTPDQFAKFERPRHLVKVNSPFAMGKYQVTRGEYSFFVQQTAYQASDGCVAWTGATFEFDSRKSWRDPGFPQTDPHPVVCVSWDDAISYAQWLAALTGKPYSLPNEAHWEYSARGGSSTARWWGDSAIEQCHYANGADASAKQRFTNLDAVECRDGYVFTSPVGSFAPNPVGLYDMLGNAWQWTSDCWASDYTKAPTEASTVLLNLGDLAQTKLANVNKGSKVVLGVGIVDCSAHTQRGGAWDEKPRALRAGIRLAISTDLRFSHSGFRVFRYSKEDDK